MATPQTVISHNHYEFQITSTDGSATVIISVEQNDGVLRTPQKVSLQEVVSNRGVHLHAGK